MMNQQETKNNLPKYWVVQCNTNNPNWKKVIDYLKNVYGESWQGTNQNAYYGYDGNDSFKGTNFYHAIKEFENTPVILTIEEFVEMTEGNVIPEYVECIKGKGSVDYNIVGNIYKVKNYDPEKGDLFLEIHEDSIANIYFGTKSRVLHNCTDYKPSTKEAFDKQQQKPKETMRTITHTQAQQIIDIACITWKVKLAAKWSKEIVLKGTIEIHEDDYQDMRRACTTEQNELFDVIFGKDVQYIPEGTPCLVRDKNEQCWRLGYSTGNGTFKTTIGISNWNQAQVLDINNLPKH